MHEIYIDYLQASTLLDEKNFQSDLFEEITPLRFYKRGYQDKIGIRTYFGNPNSPKALCIYSGSALHNWRVAQWDERSLVAELLEKDAKVSRIDWCITDYVDTALVTPQLVREIFRAGNIHGTLTNYGASTITGEKVGAPSHVETFYIGDRKRRGKSGIFRAYDKGLELGLSQDLIARLELEERQDNAHNSAKRYAEGAEIPSIMQSRLTFEHEATDRLFNTPPIDISRGDNLIVKDDFMDNERRWKWLFEQVAAGLRKAVEYDRKNGIGDERTLQFLESAGIIDISSKEPKKGKRK